MNEAVMMLCGILIGAGLGIQVVVAMTPTEQEIYEQIHRGEVKCLDTPDGKVYCYKVQKESSK